MTYFDYISVPKYQDGTQKNGIGFIHDLSTTPLSFRTDFASGNFQGKTEAQRKQAAARYEKQGTFGEALRYWKQLGFYDVLPEGDLTQVANRRAWAKNNGFENYNPKKWQDNVKLWKMLEAHFASVQLSDEGEKEYKRLNNIQ